MIIGYSNWYLKNEYECEEISKSDVFEYISKMIEYREGKASVVEIMV